MPEVLVNDFATRLANPLASGAATCTVTPGVPAALVGSSARARIGTEIVLATFTTATGWALTRQAEDADRYPQATWPAGTAVDLVLTSAGLTALAGQVTTPAFAGNTLTVDRVNGNDATALPDRADKPYLTLTAAWAAAVAGDRIRVRPGAYDLTPAAANLFKPGVRWHFEAGATVTVSGAAAGVLAVVFDSTADAAGGAVTGHGRFVNDTDASDTGGAERYIVRCNHASGGFLFEADSCSSLVNGDFSAGGVVICSAGEMTVRIRETDCTFGAFAFAGGTHALRLDRVAPDGSASAVVENVVQVTGGTLVAEVGEIAPSAGASNVGPVVAVTGGKAFITAGRISGGFDVLDLTGGESVIEVGELADSALHNVIAFGGGDHTVRVGRCDTPEAFAVVATEGATAGRLQLWVGYAECSWAVSFADGHPADQRVELLGGYYDCEDADSVVRQGSGSHTLHLMAPVFLNGKPPGAGVTVAADKAVHAPGAMADAEAPRNTLYYSTTASRLVYKDAAGVVNALY